MDAASNSFSVIQSAKEGFKAIKSQPPRLLAMAAAVNVPYFLYGAFVLAVLLPGLSMWKSNMAMLASFPFLLRIENILALSALAISLLILRPIWIRFCLKLCGTKSPRPKVRTYLSFALSHLIQFAMILMTMLISFLLMRVARIDFVQAAIISAGTLLVVTIVIRYVFFPYLIVNLGYGPIKALKESRAMTKGIYWQLFWCGAAFSICASVLSLLPLVVGLILNDVLFGTAVAMVYVKRAQQLKMA